MLGIFGSLYRRTASTLPLQQEALPMGYFLFRDSGASSVEKIERNRLAILAAIQKAGGPVSSARLVRLLADGGVDLSERTVRLYLGRLDADGLTLRQGKRGRLLTDAGRAELHAAQTIQRVGYLSAKIDQMTYAMDFDLASRTGRVVVNTSLVHPQLLADNLHWVCAVFAKGYAMGNRVALLGPGETLGDLVVPRDRVAFCTVCSITINGVLLKHGIPTISRFGGLVELRQGRPLRFVEMIDYDGTTVDPLEVFIRGGMTNYTGAVRDGNGLIGAGFREMPEAARDLIVELAQRLQAIGLGALMEIGLPGHPVLGVAPSAGRCGAVVIGGLNPIAILEERGHRVLSRALAGLLDYCRLIPADELPGAVQRFL